MKRHLPDDLGKRNCWGREGKDACYKFLIKPLKTIKLGKFKIIPWDRVMYISSKSAGTAGQGVKRRWVRHKIIS